MSTTLPEISLEELPRPRLIVWTGVKSNRDWRAIKAMRRAHTNMNRDTAGQIVEELDYCGWHLPLDWQITCLAIIAEELGPAHWIIER